MKEYKPAPADEARNANNFGYHQPHSEEQKERYANIRQMFNGVADELLRRCPPSREVSIAMTKLEEAMMWAIAAIARNEKPTATVGGERKI